MKKNIYLLYGEEQYLVKKKRNEMYADFYNDDLNTSFLTSASESEIADLAVSLPFFAEKRNIFVVGSGFFTKDSNELVNVIDSVPESTCLVFSEQDVDTKKKLFKKVKDVGTVIKYPRLKPWETVDWIRQRFLEEKKRITKTTAELLYSHTGNDMTLIDNEIEKIICYTGDRKTVSDKDIEEVASTTVNDKIFAMVDCIASGNSEEALGLYYNLLLLKEPAIKILVLITRQFEKLLRLKSFLANGIDEKTAIRTLEIQGFAYKKTAKQADDFPSEKLGVSIEQCADMQTRIQNGLIDSTLGVETLIMILCRR